MQRRRRKNERKKAKCPGHQIIAQSPKVHPARSMREVTLHSSTRHVSRLCIVNMAGSVEGRFDAAVNVVRSMPKKGINQSFHTNFFKKERCFVFLSVIFFLTCVFSVEILRSLPTFVRHDVKGMSRRQSFTYCRI